MNVQNILHWSSLLLFHNMDIFCRSSNVIHLGIRDPTWTETIQMLVQLEPACDSVGKWNYLVTTHEGLLYISTINCIELVSSSTKFQKALGGMYLNRDTGTQRPDPRDTWVR